MSELMVNNFVPSSKVFESAFGTTGTTNESNKNNSSTNVSFADTLTNALNEVNDKQVNAQTASNDLVSGDANIADVMLQTSEAKVSLQLAVQVRNKLLSAYNELMNMSL